MVGSLLAFQRYTSHTTPLFKDLEILMIEGLYSN